MQDEGLLNREIADTAMIGHGPALLFQIVCHLFVHVRITADHDAIVFRINFRQLKPVAQFTGFEQLGTPPACVKCFPRYGRHIHKLIATAGLQFLTISEFFFATHRMDQHDAFIRSVGIRATHQ